MAAGSNLQGAEAVAIGNASGYSNQQSGAIAIGLSAGAYQQGINSIALGVNAGQTNLGTNSIAIGNLITITHANTIAINASGVAFTSAQASAFYVTSLRGVAIAAPIVSYDTATGELRYNTSSIKYKTGVTDLAKDINNINASNGDIDTSTINQVIPRKFTSTIDNKPYIGFVAEELNDIDPKFVWLNQDSLPEGINWFNMLTYLISENKKLRQDVDSLLTSTSIYTGFESTIDWSSTTNPSLKSYSQIQTDLIANADAAKNALALASQAQVAQTDANTAQTDANIAISLGAANAADLTTAAEVATNLAAQSAQASVNAASAHTTTLSTATTDIANLL